MSREDRDNRPRHLVLDREDVVQFAVISFGPTMDAGRSIDELCRDTDAVAAPPDAALEQIPCVQLPADLPEIDCLALVLEGRISPDDHELGESRQLGCNV